MPLETGEFISDLNANNPVTATDIVREGAGHIRLVKYTLQQSFPAVDGAVSSNVTELNLLTGVTGKTGTGELVLSIAPTFTGLVTADEFSGNLNAGDLFAGLIPDARVPASNVTQHELALTIFEGQIADLGNYIEPGDVVSSLSIGNADTTLTRKAARTLAVEGDAVFSHESGTYNSAKVHFVDAAPSNGDGADGDIFLVY